MSCGRPAIFGVEPVRVTSGNTLILGCFETKEEALQFGELVGVLGGDVVGLGPVR
jgi:hypothetical protein